MDSLPAVISRSKAAAVMLVADLEAELAAIGESTAAVPDDEHDAEGSTVGFERARITALLHQARRTLRAIDEAIERSQRGTYGICEMCGTTIDPERLDALPTAKHCMSCASGGLGISRGPGGPGI